MRNAVLWMLFSLLLASAYAYVEILIMAVALSNSHYSLYFALSGAAGLFCWIRGLKSYRIAAATPERNTIGWNIAFKSGSLLFFFALGLGCLGLLGNIYFLILGKMS
ncbi:MAG TPA: hypothetical protein PLM53_05245 [Spirochaetota bacterium]|nr:hypothetical protein [Spirochaetota bacterium]HPC40568.1 hypothetical protein [Spirochaetota bacterium]HPL18393.1 hypothetical protein [Spirochaetota bacterium]HQF07924.1 hypothetical protein [Spirochaetota bacterium]HQH96484.1 hypothetical protein [Spirochaetota bacterium]